jgi:hypothetical protein
MSLLLDLHSKGWQSWLTDVTSPRLPTVFLAIQKSAAAGDVAPDKDERHNTTRQSAECRIAWHRGSDGRPGRRSRI